MSINIKQLDHLTSKFTKHDQTTSWLLVKTGHFWTRKKRPEKTHLLHWSQGVLEEIRIQLLETCACQGLRKVHAIIEGFNLQTLEGYPSGINSGNGKKITI
jgi:hypothetical protein